MTNIGKSVIRKEAEDKVTGRAKYTADYSSVGMLFGKTVISKHGHARINNIDVSEAEKVPGVRAIVAGERFPLTGEEIRDRPPIAVDKIRYHGEVTAIVVADSPSIAKKAATLIHVDYVPLPVVNSPREAVKKSAPLVHENVALYEKDEGVNPIPESNIANHTKIRKGNIKKGWDQSEVTVENNFSFPPSDHIAMETRSAIAEIKPNGDIHIKTSSQAPFMVKELLSAYFNIEVGKIIVDTPLVGGGYGGKASVQLEILAYLASKAVGGRVVKMMNEREEDLISSPCHMGLDATVKIGCTKEGILKAAELTYLVDSGAYSDKAIHLSRACAVDCTGPYRIDHIWCDSYAVYTNHPYPAPYRGFSHAEVHFVFERAMDILARKLRMDPLELRRKNAILPGDTSPTQVVLNRSTVGDVPQCIEKVKELSRWNEGQIIEVDKRYVRAKGIACVWKNSTIPPESSSGVVITFNEDGTLNLISGVVEIGTGTKTVLAQMVAEYFRMDTNDVYVRMNVDTQATPEHWKTVASRGTLMAGRAALAAAEDAINQIKDIASRVLKVRPDDLEVGNRRIFLREEPNRGLDFKEVVYGYTYPEGNAIGGQIIGRGNYILRNVTHLDPETGKGNPGPEWAVGAQVVEVEFDRRDYTYRILKAISVLDIGKVLNYKGALGQVTGAMCMGLGFGGRESFIFDQQGRVLNPQLRTYRPVQFGEQPEYIVEFVETPHIDAPFGARGAGEQGLLGMPAALGNSLSVAAGVELFHLPLIPESIWAEKEGRE
ncbi:MULTISPECIES: xanthine dehydrogenase family protein molybdopterin-binding subunit [Bacillaceae]|uniref:Xanthine dehydrogenase family protein molybdopterin-binding subunit n=1 Tax=Evansella alkalicola TaxID=745819 RepID=A0ABS6JWL9_9BACI|nr:MULTISPECIES: xanthine dehydrogenase family protein molybdopterin-binding subunit [Bacillaceae]MBU9722069.1 xanthine dehydrogenase family protein molybdopterin-binding subunit [Bacillus alkalicola]